MVFNFLKKMFKKRRTYTVTGPLAVHELSSDSVLFYEERAKTDAQLLKASRLSPLLWKHIFPRSSPPSQPIDFEDTVSQDSSARTSTTSSAGYGSQACTDEFSPIQSSSSIGYGSAVSADAESFSSKESSPVPKMVRFRVCETEHNTPSIYPDLRTPAYSQNLFTPAALPPKTPHRESFMRPRIERRKSKSVHFDFEIEESLSVTKSLCSGPDLLTTPRDMCNQFTPGTLPPKTPYRASFIRQEMRKRPEKSEIPVLDLNVSDAATEETSPTVKVRSSIWGSPVYSPASLDMLLSSGSSSPESPYSDFGDAFVRHEKSKISLKRIPSAAVSGRVKQMINFFENDNTRAEIPRRLDRVPSEFMRSAPEIETQTPPQLSHGHIQSNHVKGITHSSDRCIRCPAYYRTPNSRSSMT